MFGFRRQVIAQYERGLVFRQGRFDRVLEPGVYWLAAPLGGLVVQVYDLTVPEFEYPRVDFLIQEAREVVDRYFQVVELTDREVGVVYKQGRVAGLLAPGRRQVYWRGPIEVRVEKFDLTESYELPKALASVLVRAKPPLAAQVAEAVIAIEVPDTSVGLLIVDGEFTRVLEPGLRAFWKFQRALKSELVDWRVQAMEVQGPEILTREKVRVGMSCLATRGRSIARSGPPWSRSSRVSVSRCRRWA